MGIRSSLLFSIESSSFRSSPLRSSPASAAVMWRDLLVLCIVPALVFSKTIDYGKTSGYGGSDYQTTGGYKDDGYGGSTDAYSGYGDSTGYGKDSGYGDSSTGYGDDHQGYGDSTSGYGKDSGYGDEHKSYGDYSTGYGDYSSGYSKRSVDPYSKHSSGKGSTGYHKRSAEPYTKDDGYGGKTVCTPYFDTVFQEFCESYSDRVCRTTHQERCTDVPDQNCRAVVTNQQNRKCFDVTELVCKLREDVKYETVQVGFTVQKCHKVQERVCDTVFDTSFTTKENHMCIRVNNPFCKFEERTIVDKTCRTVTKFDCPTEAKGNGMGSSGGYGDSTGYGKGGDDYDSEQPQCKRSQTTKCYDTPRTVSVPRCSQKSEKVCESMPTRVPTVN